ncbi:hypothetical protein ACH4ND_02365 [Streptomyces sp. NPDC017179]|uniref:hypothetical protein n=1 Tax=Streptomyces sp. NPDC017179 TaxID=3364979 RepID=UPI003787472E
MVWTTLIGVGAGGLISFLAQHSLGRAAERAEVRRTTRERDETRRNEQLTHLIAFLTAVQAAERVAVDRYHHQEADEQWEARARQAVDRVWVTQKTIHMVCAREVNEAARGVAFAVRDVTRNGPDDPGEPQDEKVWASIRPSRQVFLDVVHDHLK